MLGYNQVPTVQGATNIICALAGIPNAAGGSAGAAVTTAVTATLSDQFGSGRLPTMPNSYAVLVSPSQACFVSVSGKTNTGFNITLTPTTSSATLAAGTFDILVVG